MTMPIIKQSPRFIAHSFSINAYSFVDPFATVTDTITRPLFVITTALIRSSDTSAPEVGVRGVPRCSGAVRC